MLSRKHDRTALVLLFVVYLVLLAWIVLFKLHLPFIGRDDMRGVKLIPFVPGDGFDASSPLEVAENVLLFVPFGIYLRTLTRRRVWPIVAVIAASSAAMEVTQYVMALGSSDLTDVLANAAGGLLGVLIAELVRRRLGDRASTVITDACAIGTLVALIIAGVIIGSFPRMNVPHGTMLI